MFCLSGLTEQVYAQGLINADAAVAAAITAQTVVLDQNYKARAKKQDATIAQELLIHQTLTDIHGVEKRTLEYMQNANGLIKNLYQFQRIATITAHIPGRFQSLVEAVPENLKGACLTVINDRMAETYAEIAALVPVIEKVCKGTSFGGDDADKVNLLNSAERFQMLNTVATRLERIDFEIGALERFMRDISVEKTVRNVSPDMMRAYEDGKSVAAEISASWKKSHRSRPRKAVLGF